MRILIAMLLLFTGSLFAEKTEYYVGGYGGISIGNTGYDTISSMDSLTNSSSTTLLLSGQVSMFLVPQFSIDAGIGYRSIQYTIDFTISGDKGAAQFSWNYLTIPLTYTYYLRFEPIAVLFQSGGEYSKILSVNSSGSLDEKDTTGSLGNATAGFDISIVLGTGISFDVANNITVYTLARYLHGVNLLDNTLGTWYNRSWAFVAGGSIKL